VDAERLCSLVRTRNCVVMGDFNGILIRGEQQFEYEPFLELPFRDVLEAVGVPAAERRTHYHFGPKPNFVQLDYIFCSDDIEVLDAAVIEGEIPINRAQRALLPSDHLFIRATIQPAGPSSRKPGTPVVPATHHEVSARGPSVGSTLRSVGDRIRSAIRRALRR
jgi:hypothetical protein